MAPRPTLARLARRLGILPRYVDTSGTTRATSDRTYAALIAALGFDGASEASAARALRALAAAASAQPIPPTRVAMPAGARRVSLALPRALASAAALEWTVEVRHEGGQRTTAGGRLARPGPTARLDLPPP